MDVLTILNIFAVLLGTIGGFGSVFAWAICPWIHAYTRVSVYIGFFAIFMVVACLEAIRRRCVRSVATGAFDYAALGLATAIGVYDQTPPYTVVDYDALKREFRSDAEFVHKIEAVLPPAR